MHKKLGVLLQPGGHIELTENPWQAVLHEVIEETGYAPNQLKVLQPKLRLKKLVTAVMHPQPITHNTHNFDPAGEHRHTDIAYAFVTAGQPLGSPQAGESELLKWVDLQELRLLDDSEIYENVRRIGEFALSEILPNWEPIDLSEFES
jgi:8-oxo-dGTP pyrophosphatase MutT (NUDIX family)